MSKPNTGKYGPEITPYLDTFHAMRRNVDYTLFHKQHQTLAKNQAKAKQYREAEPLLFEFFSSCTLSSENKEYSKECLIKEVCLFLKLMIN